MRNYPNVTGKSPFYFSQRQSIFIQPRLISDSDNPIIRSSSHSTQTFMKIAAYNVENLFDRAKGLNDDSPEAGQVVKEEAELKLYLRNQFIRLQIRKEFSSCLNH